MSNIQTVRASFLRSITVLFFLLTFSANTRASDPDYVKVYHPGIHQAEMNIIDKDYAAALNQYKEIFAMVPAPFARDYYNAAVCALLVNDEKQTLEYLEQLVLKGVSLNYLENQAVFEPLHGTRKWKKFKRKYSKHRRAFEQAANLDLRADLDELYARDQYFRQAEGGLRVYGDTLRKIEASNVQNLLNWIEEFGYPGENLIGVADTLEEMPRFSIVIQRQTKATRGYDFTDILTAAVHDGKIKPQAAAYLMDKQAGNNKYLSKAFIKINCDCPEREGKAVDRYLVQSMTAQQQTKINDLRAQLGLEPIADYRKKIQYNLEDKRFKLTYAWSIANYIVPSQEAAEVLMEGLTVAD